jgi:hypothetical protein
MPNFSLTLPEQLNQVKKRLLLESDEKFKRLVKDEGSKSKYEHHYRKIECSIQLNGEFVQIIVLYDGFGKPIASMRKTWFYKINEDTLERQKFWDMVADVRELRTIALEHYFRRIKKRSKDGFMFD